ncbi:DUF1565 domain-containing protein [Candidatus Poribacteria bacterium]|nr:DUF1565 domain-containing protein [Candidatus Poribacteria bacterium]
MRLYLRFVVALTFLAAASIALAATRHVPGEFPSIQAAIDASSPGDEVRVSPGPYSGQVVLKSGVNVVGSGVDMTTLTRGEGSVVYAGNLASGTTLSDLTIAGVWTADVGVDCHAGANLHIVRCVITEVETGAACDNANITFDRVSIGPTIRTGITINSSNVTVVNSSIAHAGSNGIHSINAAFSVLNSAISDAGRGIAAGGVSSAVIENSSITRCSIGLDTWDTSRPRMRGTDISDCSEYAVNVWQWGSPDLGNPGDVGLNTFDGSGLFQVRDGRNDTTDPIMAVGNWWGVANPSAALFEGNVAYTPWLPSPDAHPPRIALTRLPDAVAGEPYTYDVAPAASGLGALSYTAEGLPPGLSVDTDTGALNGVPTEARAYSVVITVTDETGLPGSAELLLAVLPAGSPLPVGVISHNRAALGDLVGVTVRIGRPVTDLDAMTFVLAVSPLGVLAYDHVDVNGTFFEGASVTDNPADPARLRFGLNHGGTAGVSGEGDLAHVVFRVVGDDASVSVALEDVELSDTTATPIASQLDGASASILVRCVPGDATGDGAVNVLDVTKMERIVALLDAVPSGACPDANQDGATNVLDVTSTERLVVGLPAVAPAPQAARAPLVTISTVSDTGDVVTLRVDVRGVLRDVDAGSFELSYAEADYGLVALTPTGWHADASRTDNDSPGRAIRVLNAPGVGGVALSGAVTEIVLHRKVRDAAGPIALDIHIGDTSGRSLLLRSFAIPTMRVPPATTALPNFPNPFNPETWIPFDLAEQANVVVRVYNTGGSLVRTLDLGPLPAGAYADRPRAAYWDGRNDAGEPVAGGVYHYEIRAGGYRATRRMVILK